MRALLASLLCLLVTSACLGQSAAPAKVPVVFAAYATPLEEPWNQVIHKALQDAEKTGRITYAWQDKLSTAAAMASGLNSALVRRPDVIVADGVESLDAIKAAAAANPGITFLVGTSQPPVAPNLSTFDSNLSEPAYLCGIAWYDPPKAKQAALAQIAAGADLIWAEREGAIEGAREKGVLAFGNLVDQTAEGPETVLTGPVWSMAPLIDHVAKLSGVGMIRSENYIDFSSLARGGAVLAPWHGWNEKLPADVLELVRERQNAIKVGAIVIAPSANRPVGE